MHLYGPKRLAAGICTVICDMTQNVRARVVLVLALFPLGLPLAGQSAGARMQSERVAESRSVAAPNALPAGSFTVKNPQQLEVPDARAKELHQIVQEVVSDYLRGRDKSVQQKREAPALVLVLGEDREHYTYGGIDQVDTIYLQSWDEAKFVASDVSLSFQHQLSGDNLNRMMEEISRRTARFLPVTLDDLRKRGAGQLNRRPPPISNPCVKAMTDASQIGVRCGPGRTSLP